jgi:hypothetical protein
VGVNLFSFDKGRIWVSDIRRKCAKEGKGEDVTANGEKIKEDEMGAECRTKGKEKRI